MCSDAVGWHAQFGHQTGRGAGVGLAVHRAETVNMPGRDRLLAGACCPGIRQREEQAKVSPKIRAEAAE
eukprot:359993-Chlamydomonas_euryale.AAC.9